MDLGYLEEETRDTRDRQHAMIWPSYLLYWQHLGCVHHIETWWDMGRDLDSGVTLHFELKPSEETEEGVKRWKHLNLAVFLRVGEDLWWIWNSLLIIGIRERKINSIIDTDRTMNAIAMKQIRGQKKQANWWRDNHLVICLRNHLNKWLLTDTNTIEFINDLSF